MANLRKFSSLGWLAVLALAGCRQDMHDQPRFKPLAMSDFYADLRSARPPVEGAVARGQLREDAYFYTGKIGNNPGDYLPFPATREVLERGQQRFNIYCAPCHSRLGDGNGMVVQRGYKHPPSFHQDRLRNAPIGYFYDIMTNGLGAMPDYTAQVQPADRWAIAVYIRALQQSQNAQVSDVAPADVDKLKAPITEENGIKIPSTSTTSPSAMRPEGGVKK